MCTVNFYITSGIFSFPLWIYRNPILEWTSIIKAKILKIYIFILNIFTTHGLMIYALKFTAYTKKWPKIPESYNAPTLLFGLITQPPNLFYLPPYLHNPCLCTSCSAQRLDAKFVGMLCTYCTDKSLFGNFLNWPKENSRKK